MAAYTITDAKDPDSVILGLGRMGLGAFPQGSPGSFIDVGYIKGAEFSYNREVKEFESGGILVKVLVFRDRFKLSAQWAEIKPDNLHKFFQGTKVGNNIYFGGQRTATRYAVRHEFQKEDGSAMIQTNMYKALPSGEFKLAFAEEQFVTFPVEFEAQADTTKTSGQQYGSIIQAA